MRSAERLYRASAVRRLNAAEETDELPAFVRVPGWLAAAALVLAALAGAAWTAAAR